MRERTRLETAIRDTRALEQGLDDNIGLIELGEAEGEEAIVTEAEQALRDLHAAAERARLASLLSGAADATDSLLTIHAGPGGTAAQDWPATLLSTSPRWADGAAHQAGLVERDPGADARPKAGRKPA